MWLARAHAGTGAAQAHPPAELCQFRQLHNGLPLCGRGAGRCEGSWGAAELQAFHASLYQPHNVTVVIVGAARPDQVTSTVRSVFEGIATAGASAGSGRGEGSNDATPSGVGSHPAPGPTSVVAIPHSFDAPLEDPLHLWSTDTVTAVHTTIAQKVPLAAHRVRCLSDLRRVLMDELVASIVSMRVRTLAAHETPHFSSVRYDCDARVRREPPSPTLLCCSGFRVKPALMKGVQFDRLLWWLPLAAGKRV